MDNVNETMSLSDSITKEEAVITIRLVEGKIGVGLSLLNNGDVEVFLEATDCQALIDKLQETVRTANNYEKT